MASDGIAPRDVCVVGVARTPMGGFLGALSSLPAAKLGSVAIEAALRRANVDPALVQEVYFGNVLSANLGQAPARQAALGVGIPNTVVCTTVNKVCASGTKEMDLWSFYSCDKLTNYKCWKGSCFGHDTLVDAMLKDGLWDVYNDCAMGMCAELCADNHALTREDQAPELFTTTPALAIPKAIANAGIESSHVDFYEINEAFSAVALANQKLLGIPSEKINVHGGAVSLGHPLGCSGARILVTLLGVLREKGGKIGVAGVCNGGGGASALVLELA